MRGPGLRTSGYGEDATSLGSFPERVRSSGCIRGRSRSPWRGPCRAFTGFPTTQHDRLTRRQHAVRAADASPYRTASRMASTRRPLEPRPAARNVPHERGPRARAPWRHCRHRWIATRTPAGVSAALRRPVPDRSLQPRGVRRKTSDGDRVRRPDERKRIRACNRSAAPSDPAASSH
jgi:hypothetical protein